MIPYLRFDSANISQIDLSKYDKLSLPFVHYRAVRVIHLDDRFVLVHNRGIWDTQQEALIAHPDGPRFYPAARWAAEEIQHLTFPYVLRTISGVWILENTSTGRKFLYVDDTGPNNLVALSSDLIKKALASVETVREYVEAININSALKDYSTDLCEMCLHHNTDHLRFHMCRGELGASLVSELSGMVKDGEYTHSIDKVKSRINDVLRLILVYNPYGIRPTLQVDRDSEKYFTESCPWNLRHR